MKKSASNTNQTVMRLFESKIDNNTPTDQERLGMSLKVGMLNTRLRKIKTYQWQNTLKKLGPIYMI